MGSIRTATKKRQWSGAGQRQLRYFYGLFSAPSLISMIILIINNCTVSFVMYNEIVPAS